MTYNFRRLATAPTKFHDSKISFQANLAAWAPRHDPIKLYVFVFCRHFSLLCNNLVLGIYLTYLGWIMYTGSLSSALRNLEA